MCHVSELFLEIYDKLAHSHLRLSCSKAGKHYPQDAKKINFTDCPMDKL